MNRESTGKFDRNNREVFVGDKIMHCWGWFNLDGEMKASYQIHTIKKLVEGNIVSYNMGSCYNLWSDGDVAVLSDQDLKEINMPEETHFFFKDGVAIKREGRHWFGLSEEQYKKLEAEDLERDRKMWFNILSNEETD